MRKHVAGSGKNKKGRFIVIEAPSKSKARERFNKIKNDSDKGSIFRTITKDVTKQSKNRFKVYYVSRYHGKKKR